MNTPTVRPPLQARTTDSQPVATPQRRPQTPRPRDSFELTAPSPGPATSNQLNESFMRMVTERITSAFSDRRFGQPMNVQNLRFHIDAVQSPTGPGYDIEVRFHART